MVIVAAGAVSSQTASAAALLSISPNTGDGVIVTPGPATKVDATSDTGDTDTYNLSLSALAGHVGFRFDPANVTEISILKDGGNVIVGAWDSLLAPAVQYFELNNLAAGAYLLSVKTTTVSTTNGQPTPNYNLTVTTPIPAAIWLFGSALMGLVSFSRRKSFTA